MLMHNSFPDRETNAGARHAPVRRSLEYLKDPLSRTPVPLSVTLINHSEARCLSKDECVALWLTDI
jgi:hypothetical protein